MSEAQWRNVSLGDHCEIASGFPFPSSGFTDDPDDVPLVKGENIGQGEVLWGISKRWPRSDLENLERFRLVSGDVVLAMDRPWIPAGLKFAKIHSVAPEALLVQRVARLRARSGLSQAFLPHLVGSPNFVAYIQNVARGVGVPHISGKQISSFEFSMPPVRAQEAIAEVLGSYDDLIENNRRRIALLEESARLLYREWFVRLRFPGYEHTRITDEVPASWHRIPLDEVLVLQRGFDLPAQARADGEFPIYGASGINGYHSVAKVMGPGVVTGRAGSLGIVHFVPGDFWPLNTSLWVKEFRRVTPLFALHLLRTMHLEGYGQGATMPMLDRKVVHKVPVLLPPASIMASFETFAADVQRQIQTLEQQKSKLRAARDLLLPRLMSGELVV